MSLPTFLPGRFVIERGDRSDYDQLQCFHYRPKRPRTWVGVWGIWFVPELDGGGGGGVASDAAKVKGKEKEASMLVGVGVLSWPTAVSSGRDVAFGLSGKSYGEKIRFANANLRTISRIIVHPQFRSLGLATELIRCLCDHCPTRYVEAAAQMGRAHPLFSAAGMTRVEPVNEDKPVYYFLDRGEVGR